jgi:hypothetical protein
MAIRISVRPEESHDLSGLGMPAKRPLGEHQAAIDRHFEHPAGRGDQAHVGIGPRLLELGRQTGGSRLVVSDNAVFDDGAHTLPAGGSSWLEGGGES